MAAGVPASPGVFITSLEQELVKWVDELVKNRYSTIDELAAATRYQRDATEIYGLVAAGETMQAADRLLTIAWRGSHQRKIEPTKELIRLLIDLGASPSEILNIAAKMLFGNVAEVALERGATDSDGTILTAAREEWTEVICDDPDGREDYYPARFGARKIYAALGAEITADEDADSVLADMRADANAHTDIECPVLGEMAIEDYMDQYAGSNHDQQNQGGAGAA